MRLITESDWKQAQLARWENEGGSCPECGVMDPTPPREAERLTGPRASDTSRSRASLRDSPSGNSSGKPRL